MSGHGSTQLAMRACVNTVLDLTMPTSHLNAKSQSYIVCSKTLTAKNSN